MGKKGTLLQACHIAAKKVNSQHSLAFSKVFAPVSYLVVCSYSAGGDSWLICEHLERRRVGRVWNLMPCVHACE